MPSIIPAILAKSQEEAKQKLEQISQVAHLVQLDVMDGHFVPNTTWFNAEEFFSFHSPVDIELHLMVQHPDQVFQAWHTIPNLKRLIWHLEIPIDHDRLIDQCHDAGFECGLAISPKTPVSALTPYLNHLDEALILGVEPGWSNQELIQSTISKIEDIKSLRPELPVGFDGGVNQKTIPVLALHGADRLYAASAIFTKENPAETYLTLQQLIHT